MESDFPNCVKEFIHAHIHSLAQLDILLTLYQGADQYWPVDQIANGLYLRPQIVNEILVDLVHSGYAVQKEASFRFSPATDTVRGLIDRLAQLYHERRVAVIAEVFAKPIDSVNAFLRPFDSRKAQ